MKQYCSAKSERFDICISIFIFYLKEVDILFTNKILIMDIEGDKFDSLDENNLGGLGFEGTSLDELELETILLWS